MTSLNGRIRYVKKMVPFVCSILILLLMVTGCKWLKKENDNLDNKEVELTISAAASLQGALNDIKTTFENEHPNVKIIYNFGGSGTLQQQISHGAPVDLFFSAAEDKFDQLVENGLIEKKKGIDLVGNDLVLVVPKDSTEGIKDFYELNKDIRIAIGTPETVPVGQYAKETLQNINIWNDVKEKVIFAKDARQVLTYVETGSVDAGIIYKTDAIASKKVKIVATADNSTHSPIIYPFGVLKRSTHVKEAQLYYEYIQKEKSMNVFKKYGFKLLKR